MDILQPAENALDRFLDIGIQMHRIQDFDISVCGGNLLEGGADLFKAGAKVFPPMPGDQN